MAFDPLPVNYRTSAPSLVNLDFVDAASGTGYIEYFGGRLNNAQYGLSNFPFYSEMVGTSAVIGNHGFIFI